MMKRALLTFLMFAVAAALVVCGLLVFVLWDRGR